MAQAVFEKAAAPRRFEIAVRRRGLNEKMRILLIEDDDRIVSFLKRGLEAEHYHVDAVNDGIEGMEMAKAIFYDLIILDLLLPSMSGMEICRVLRAEKVSTPILILTARNAVEDKVEGFGTGADDYLTKPFAFGELLARMKALLRRVPSHEAVSPLKVVDLVLDRETREVRRGERAVDLTAKEFSLLEYLMRHPDRVLTRTAILEAVWGYHFNMITNVVDVYISHLRKKIDDGHPQKLIRTVRDIGYKISTEAGD